MSLGGRVNNFDFLRLFLAVLVIFSHSFPLGAALDADESFIRLTRGQTTGGTIAVNFFFIISGYLITASFLRAGSVPEYLGNRVRRIYPAFVAAALVGSLVIVPLAGGVVAGDGIVGWLVNLIWNTLRLHEFVQLGAFSRNSHPNIVNGSPWTVAYEE